MKIQGKNVASKITIGTIARFASAKGIPMKRVDEFLDNITTDDLFDLFLSGLKDSKLTLDDLYDEWDENSSFIGELSIYISEQLDPKNPAVVK